MPKQNAPDIRTATGVRGVHFGVIIQEFWGANQGIPIRLRTS